LTASDKLYNFQREDVERLTDLRSVLIGNEMGTGKTYEAVALDEIRREEVSTTWETSLRTLVVAPLSVLPVWEEHYNELVPYLRTVVIDPKNRGVFLSSLKNDSHDVYIVHWDVLRIIKDELREVFWFHIIADEVHRAKNRKAQQTRALKLLKTKFRSGLSGTPATNKPYDLWSVLDWLYPKPFGMAFWKFYERYCDYAITYPQGYRQFRGVRNTDELKAKMAPFYARRMKKDVLKDLPDKYYTTIWVELTPKQRRAYDEMQEEMVAWLETQEEDKPLVAPVVIAQLIRLQQFSVAYADITYDSQSQDRIVRLTEPSSKLDALMDLIQDNEGEPIVVFSQFKQLINLATSRLERSKIEFVTITGDVGPDDRRRAVEDFQNGNASVFLGTIGAGGEGITLTASSTVVFLDRDWSPARNAQAEDRLHRIGQENAVQVIDIASRKTIDVRKRGQLEMKRKWLAQILNP